jgi:hypothetical protein
VLRSPKGSVLTQCKDSMACPCVTRPTKRCPAEQQQLQCMRGPCQPGADTIVLTTATEPFKGVCLTEVHTKTRYLQRHGAVAGLPSAPEADGHSLLRTINICGSKLA